MSMSKSMSITSPGFRRRVFFARCFCPAASACSCVENGSPFRMGFRSTQGFRSDPIKVDEDQTCCMILVFLGLVLWPSRFSIHTLDFFQDRLEVVSQDSLEPSAAHGIWSSESSRLPVVLQFKKAVVAEGSRHHPLQFDMKQSDGEGFFHPLRSLSESNRCETATGWLPLSLRPVPGAVPFLYIAATVGRRLEAQKDYNVSEYSHSLSIIMIGKGRECA